MFRLPFFVMYVLTYAFFQPFILNYTLTYKCIKPLQVQGLTYVKVKSVPEVYRILKQVMHIFYLFIPHVKIEYSLVCPSSALPRPNNHGQWPQLDATSAHRAPTVCSSSYLPVGVTKLHNLFVPLYVYISCISCRRYGGHHTPRCVTVLL